MADQDVSTTVRNFLVKRSGKDDIGDDEDIFANGIVNSLFAVEIVCFVEESFEITVENEDLDIANFRSVNALTQFIEQKTAGA